MKNHLLVSIRMTVILAIITCGIYPAAVWAIGQLAFNHQANGSLIERNGKVIGSELIGQSFTSDRFFHPRPPRRERTVTIRQRPAARITVRRQRSCATRSPPPWETGVMFQRTNTASASGLDPHISPANAYDQAARVARANHMTEAQVRALIDRHTEGRFLGIYGEPRVNVLALNLELQK